MSSNIEKFPDLGADLTGSIIESAISVHRELGPGLLESVYESCLYYELSEKNFDVEKQLFLPVRYKNKEIDQGFRIDLRVNKKVLIELKAVDSIQPIHRAQIITYMRLSQTPLGLLINFNKKLLSDGVQRFALSEFEGL